MRLNLTLRRRVERAEKRQRYRKPKLAIIAAIHPDEQPGPIVGIECNGKRVERTPGENVASLQRRAMAELTGRFMRVVYADSPRNDETAPMAPEPPKEPESAPWQFLGVPGVGRIASRDELEKAAAAQVPPERLI